MTFVDIHTYLKKSFAVAYFYWLSFYRVHKLFRVHKAIAFESVKEISRKRSRHSEVKNKMMWKFFKTHKQLAKQQCPTFLNN